jgi:Eukaryotic aspartyl protease
MTGYLIGANTSSATPKPVSYQSIADTGTTLMLLPLSIVKDYYSHVPGARNVASEGGYVFPCNSTLPNLTVLMGNGTGSAATAVVDGMFVNRSISATGSGLCYGGIQQGSDTLSIWGDVFLKSQFAVFDAGSGVTATPRVGFAKQAVPVADGNAMQATPTTTASGRATKAASGTAAATAGSESSQVIGESQKSEGFRTLSASPFLLRPVVRLAKKWGLIGRRPRMRMVAGGA